MSKLKIIRGSKSLAITLLALSIILTSRVNNQQETTLAPGIMIPTVSTVEAELLILQLILEIEGPPTPICQDQEAHHSIFTQVTRTPKRLQRLVRKKEQKLSARG